MSTQTNKALRYTKRLVGFDTSSKLSNRLICKYLEMKLTKHGFVVERVAYLDSNRVRKINLIAKKGAGHGGLAYFGHTDVVPARRWFTKKAGPFEPKIARDRLYGRGTCDMKGSIACMLTAVQRFSWDDLKKPFYFVLTADEEIGFGGAKQVVEESKYYREMVDHQTKAIIGEPTSLEVVHAHKGSCKITAVSRGVAAHSSGTAGRNANLDMIPFLAEMKSLHDESMQNTQWQDEAFDPPTISMNICVRDNMEAFNVTPSKSVCRMYVRSMPRVDMEPVYNRIRAAAKKHEVKLKMQPFNGFWSEPDSPFVADTLQLVHKKTPRTVSFGTDGGVLTELQDKIVFGPGNIAQAHTFDEWISLEQLEQGTEMYSKLIRHWCC